MGLLSVIMLRTLVAYERGTRERFWMFAVTLPDTYAPGFFPALAQVSKMRNCVNLLLQLVLLVHQTFLHAATYADITSYYFLWSCL